MITGTSVNAADSTGALRARGLTGPSTGSGAEVWFSGGTAFFIGWNRDTSAFLPVSLNGSTVTVGGTPATPVGFYGVAPVVRPAAYTLTYPTNTRTLAADAITDPAATAATNAAPFGYTTAAQADAIRAAVIEAHVELNNIRQVLRQVIVDLQANGLLQ